MLLCVHQVACVPYMPVGYQSVVKRVVAAVFIIYTSIFAVQGLMWNQVCTRTSFALIITYLHVMAVCVLVL